MKKAVQQFMLGTVMNNEKQARETLAAIKKSGFDGIELCGFMIHPMGLVVRLLTKAAGMPVGKGGNLNWHALVKESDWKLWVCIWILGPWRGISLPVQLKRKHLEQSTLSSPECTASTTAVKRLLKN